MAGAWRDGLGCDATGLSGPVAIPTAKRRGGMGEEESKDMTPWTHFKSWLWALNIPLPWRGELNEDAILQAALKIRRPTPIVRRGEQVTCLNGHLICDCIEDLHLGDMNWSEAFGNWRRQADIPELGSEQKPNCSICGAPFIDQRPGNWRFHYADGTWKPETWGP